MPILSPIDPLRLPQMLRSAASAITRAVRADHITLNQRSLRSYSGVSTHAYLHAAVAPSRRIRPLGADAFADAAASFAESLGLPHVPTMAGTGSQRFETPGDDGAPTRELFLTRSGVVELLWALEQRQTDDASWSVSALDACAALARFTELIRGEGYGRMLGQSRWSQRWHSRVDWSLGVLPSTMRENGPRGWRDIVVEGPQPDRATNQAFGFMPPHGYGAQRLWNVKRSLDAHEVLQTLLCEWLQANGYLHTGSAVQRTIDAALASSSPAA